MMKKWISWMMALTFVVLLAGCGNVEDVKVIEQESAIYSERDIESAIKTTKRYFKRAFSGCSLKEISYVGDDKMEDLQEWANDYKADEVIVLTSSFDVDSSGGDGSLNPNSTYKNWQWILVRNHGGRWKHVDHGY